MTDFNNSIITKRRLGTSEDPFVSLSEAHTIENSVVQLSEIPDSFQKVTVTGQSITWAEQVSGIPTANTYVVDYNINLVTFHSSREGLQLQFDFKGMGMHFIPASMVYTNAVDGEVIQTLKDVAGSSSEASTVLSNLNSAIGTGGTTNTTLNLSISNAISTKNSLDNSESIAELTKSELDAKNSEALITKTDLTNINVTATNTKNDLTTLIENNQYSIESENTREEQEDTRQSNEVTRESQEENRQNTYSSGHIKFKGVITGIASLPVSGNILGDTYQVINDATTSNNAMWRYNGTIFEKSYVLDLTFAGGYGANDSQVFTATANQTLFTLTEFPYLVGVNQLMVYVAGIKQIIGINYTETSTNSFTLTSGVIAGIKVEAFRSVPGGAGSLTTQEVENARVSSLGIGYPNLKARLDDHDSNKVGVLSGLPTVAKTDIVSSITEFYDDVASYKAENTTELALKRDTATLIKNTDMDTSSDANKIKPINISDELMLMFSPAGTVSPVIPVGGVGMTHVANKAINYDHLLKGEIVANIIDTNSLLKGINFVKGNNFFNKYLEYYPDTLITGSFSTSTLYDAYIWKFTAGTYTFKGYSRQIYAYDEYKKIAVGQPTINISTVAKNGITTFTVAYDFYLVINLYKTSADKILQKGSEIVSVVEDTSDVVVLKSETVVLKSDVETLKNEVGMMDNSEKVSVTVTNGTYAITSKFNDENDIIITTTLDQTYTNGVFEFNKVDLKDLSDVVTPIVIGNVDDITPVRISTGTVGANHGHGCFNCNKNGQVQADAGSTWTDGVNTYTLVKVDATKATFLYPYTETDGIITHSSPSPVATLTHVLGGTNTGDISIVGIATAQQLFPSINNKETKFYHDNIEITADGTFSCDKFIVREKYNIMCYKEIQEYLKSHIGSYHHDDNILGAVQLGIEYVFTTGGKCLISHSLKAIKKQRLGENGFVQAGSISSPNGTLFRYLPNIKIIGGYEFKYLVDMTSYASNLKPNWSHLDDPTKPMNRYVDIIKNSGVTLYGFMMGYIPDKSNGKDSVRALNDVHWDLRSTKKSYPIAIKDLTIMEVGEYKTFMCYRNYFPHVAGETCFTEVESGNDTYVFIDYHTPVNTNFKLSNKHLGKNITVVESEGFTLFNDVVDVNGVSFSIPSAYGYAVLKLN